MRLTAAIPCLLDFLGAEDLQADSESERALVKLATDQVIAEAVQRYPSSKRDYRIGMESILEALQRFPDSKKCREIEAFADRAS